MSLINKMLQDLDARGGGAQGTGAPVEVRPVSQPDRWPRTGMAAGAGVLVVVLAGAGYAGWQYLRKPSSAPAAQTVTVPPRAAAAAPASKVAQVAQATAVGAALSDEQAMQSLARARQLAADKAARDAQAHDAASTERTVPAADAGRADVASRAPQELAAKPRRTAGSATAAAATAFGHEGAGHGSAGGAAPGAAMAASGHDAGGYASAGKAASGHETGGYAGTGKAASGVAGDARVHGGAASKADRHVAAADRKARGSAAGGVGAAGAGGAAEEYAVGSQQRAENEYRRALGALQDGRVSEAVAGLEQAVYLYPRHDAARQTLVGLLVERKQYADAIRHLQFAISLDPRQSNMTMLLARLQSEQGGPAIETLQRGLQYASGNAEYRALLAGMLQRTQRNHEAVEQYQAALKLQPSNGVWWMGLGISLQADKRAAEAHDAFVHARDSGRLTPELQAFVERKLQQPAGQ
ncbi:tetratricopeptide repeat protein [Pseudoduganella sp. RAF19]|uniref:tetratricopeptide repeat protein n=1 Tax=Pseudoduganella sp. RAF19 TaxID=3233052 RepID=UPI003F96B1C1